MCNADDGACPFADHVYECLYRGTLHAWPAVSGRPFSALLIQQDDVMELNSKHTLICAIAIALGTAAGAGHAGETCELNDGDPTTHEFAGGATAAGVSATACGGNADASGAASTAFGMGSESTGTVSVAIGFASDATAEGSSAFGANSTATGTGGTALGFASISGGFHSVATGGYAFASGEVSSAYGFQSAATAGAASAFGNFATASGLHSTALGGLSVASAENSVALGHSAVADRVNTVSVGTTTSQRQIVNVAAGTQATDAANLSQLQDTLATANAYTDTAVATGGTATNAYTDNRETAIRSDMDAADAVTLSTANTYADTGDTATLTAANTYTDTQIRALAGFDPAALNGRLDGIDQQLGVHDRRINIVGALGAALSMATPDARVKGANQFSMGVGHFRDRQAVAVGYSRLMTARTTVRLGAAFADGENAAGVGFNVGW